MCFHKPETVRDVYGFQKISYRDPDKNRHSSSSNRQQGSSRESHRPPLKLDNNDVSNADTWSLDDYMSAFPWLGAWLLGPDPCIHFYSVIQSHGLLCRLISADNPAVWTRSRLSLKKLKWCRGFTMSPESEDEVAAALWKHTNLNDQKASDCVICRPAMIFSSSYQVFPFLIK